MTRSVRTGVVVFALTLLAPASLFGQQRQSLAVESHFLGYTFDDGVGAEVANIVLFPVAYRLQATDAVAVDVYSAVGRGQVEQDGTVFELAGLVDSRVRVSYRASEWANLTVALNLPSGNSSHDSEEGVVASVLSSDLLGFRETTFGIGLGMTTGIATATRVGEWGLGLGASYRMQGEFEPVADSAIGYQPGNEMRIRAGVDRAVGESGTLSAGVTWQNFSDDQVDGRNLFQAGARVSADLAYAFRAGSTTWSMYAANVWRENGDLFLDLIDGNGAVVGDTILTTASQNLAIARVQGSVPVGSRYRVRPTVDLRVQDREEVDGNAAGSGWMLGAGLDFPVRVFGFYDVFPAVQYLTGRIDGADGVRRGVRGFSGTLTVRWTF